MEPTLGELSGASLHSARLVDSLDGGNSSVTFDDLHRWTNQLGAGEKLTAEAKRRIEAELPGFIRDLNPASALSRLRLPTGESSSNATRMTALKCQCLFLARKVFGANYLKANEEYEYLAKDILFWVMRHAFNSGEPKGIFCCPACTLSLLPLYAASCFRWVDCDELTSNVLTALKKGTSVFAGAHPKAYAQWAVSLSSRARR
jgi:hypothetical protein